MCLSMNTYTQQCLNLCINTITSLKQISERVFHFIFQSLLLQLVLSIDEKQLCNANNAHNQITLPMLKRKL